MELRKRRKIDSHIDLTPMIDTMLQLFLIFLLSATFVSASLNLDLPKAGGKPKSPKIAVQQITVSMDADKKLYLNGQVIERTELVPGLKVLMEKAEKSVVLLLADRRLVYEQVLDVLVEIKGSGADSVNLAYNLKPEKK